MWLLIIRFRLRAVGISADIERAFLQIGLNQIDRDVTRFLWIKDPEIPKLESNLKVYRFARVPFGLKSSPFLLAATINKHLGYSQTDVAKVIKHNIYVDNVMISVPTSEIGSNIYLEAKNLFKTASINLRDWATNSIELRKIIPINDRIKRQRVKILGLIWNLDQNTIQIQGVNIPKPSVHELPNNTKRQVLKNVASIFDPLGLLCPITLHAKLFILELWKRKLDWDEIFPKELNDKWIKIREEILNIS